MFTSEALNVAGPIATIIAMIAFIYWGLAREWLVTGAAHRREITDKDKQIASRDKALADERANQLLATAALREDYEKQLARRDSAADRREVETSKTIAELRADSARLFGAWQLSDDALARVTDSRNNATGEMMRTVLEALAHSPIRDRLDPLPIAPPQPDRGGADGNDGPAPP